MAQALKIPRWSSPTPEETEAEGKELFRNFVIDEITSNGLDPQALNGQEVANSSQDACDSVTRPQFANNAPAAHKMTKVGKALKELAEEFAQSKQREDVRQRANQIDVTHLSKEDFFQLLTELFENRDHPLEKIVTLFFFCSDLLVNVLRTSPLLNYGFKIFQWCMQYISNNVCQWVQTQGGWNHIFSNVSRILYLVTSVVVIAAAIVYIRKNW